MRLKELDALRGLAALAVVLYHYTTQYNKLYIHSTPLGWELNKGSLGVHLFFMISGFVIFLTIDKISSSKAFIISRFSRLFPAYWFAIILTSSAVFIMGLPGEERDLVTILLNFSMIQGFFDIPDVDGVYWTLLYELIFYILILALFKFKLLTKVNLIIVLGLCLNIANSLTDIFPWKLQLILLLEYNHLFGAGIIYYLIKKNGIRPSYSLTLFLCLIALWMQGSTENFLIISSFFIVFYLFSLGKLQFIAVKPLIWLGTISYSLYLLHQNIGYIIIRNIEGYGFSSNIAIIFALMLSLLMAHAAQKLIERPTQKWIKSKFN